MYLFLEGGICLSNMKVLLIYFLCIRDLNIVDYPVFDLTFCEVENSEIYIYDFAEKYIL